MRPAKPLTLLGLVVLVHALVLWGLRQELLPAVVIEPLPEPVFLHLLAPKAAAIKRAPSKREVAPAQSASLARNASVTSDSNLANPQNAAPEPPSPDEAIADPSPASSPSAAATPEAAPSGSTESAKPDPKPRDTWPADTRVSYEMRGFYRGDVYGSAKVQWQRQQERYQVQLDMRMALLFQVSMTSQGQVTASGLVPQAYEERFLSVRRSVGFEEALLRLQDGRQLAKPAGVQDTASQFVELSQRFASGRQTLAVGEVVTVWLARPGGLDLWTYDVTELVGLQTPQLGLVQAFHLKPRPLAKPRGDIVAEIWLAPSLQYLPVRVRIALGGDNFVDLLMETIEQGAPPPSQEPLPGPRGKP
jgi:hypothetical protein